VQLAPFVVAAFAYAVRARTLARRGRPVAVWRQACFFGGLMVVGVALLSPIDPIGEERLFWVHMVQHILLGDVAALLVVLGLDGAILRPLLALPLVRHLRALAHPLVALPLWTVNLFAWHLPGAYEAALAHAPLHALEHCLFFVTGCLMWAAVVEPLPGPAWFGSGWKAAYVLVVRTAGAALANVFIWAGTPIYDWYAAGERRSGVSPLADQVTAGAIMLIEGGFVTLLVFAWLFLRWTREAELRQSLEERGADPARAARAARYSPRAPTRPEPPPPRAPAPPRSGQRAGAPGTPGG
jgi:cytochrome c oxidase assembly factor CtaG